MSGDLPASTDAPGVAAGTADRRFLRSSALVGGLTLLSRLTGFAREVLLAGAFGTTPAASALVLAQTVPNLSRSLASEEVAQGTLVPSLAGMTPAERRDDGWRVVWISGLVATGVLTVVCLAVLVLARWLTTAIAPGLDGAALDQTAKLLALLAPVIVINGPLGAGSAYLVSERRFGLVGLSAVFSNVPVLIGLVAFPEISIERVALLLVAGYGLQAAFVGAAAVLVRGRSGGPARRVPFDGERVRRQSRGVALLAAPIVLSLCMANFSGLVDMAFSSLVSSAAPAALDKAFRLLMLPYGVFAVAMGIVALPRLAEAAKPNGGFDAELMRATRFLAAILVPVAVAVGLLADDLVGLAYERGAFDAASRSLTADALTGLAFALPALGCSLVGTRAWISRRRPWRPAAAAFAGVLVNAGLDAALIGPLGVAGIGVATAVAHVSVGLFLTFTASDDRRRVGRELAAFLARLGGLVAAATLAGVGTAAALASGNEVLAHAGGLAVGGVVLVLAAPSLGVSDYRLVLSSVLRRG